MGRVWDDVGPSSNFRSNVRSQCILTKKNSGKISIQHPRFNKAEKSRPQKGTSRAPIECTLPNSSFLRQF